MSISRVLIVDDQHETRQVLRAALATLPSRLEIVDVPSGEEAMLIISAQPFDLLVTDIRLAGISGLELMAQVRQRNPEVKIILVTGTTDVELREKLAKVGAEAYFFKPIEMAEFLRAILSLLGEVDRQEPPSGHDRASESVHTLVEKDDAFTMRQDFLRLDRTEIVERLQDWVEELGVLGLAYTDARGNIFAQAGDWLSWEMLKAISAFAQQVDRQEKTFSDVLGLGETAPGGGWFIGDHCVLWQVVTENNYLFGLAERELLKLHPQALFAFQLVAEQLATFRQDFERVEKPEEELKLDEADQTDESPENEADLGELDQLLSATSEKDISEVDAFWEAATRQVDYEDLEQKGLSYDQARQLGLTPDD
jgi:CheY-like chemotaxis protein